MHLKSSKGLVILEFNFNLLQTKIAVNCVAEECYHKYISSHLIGFVGKVTFKVHFN